MVGSRLGPERHVEQHRRTPAAHCILERNPARARPPAERFADEARSWFKVCIHQESGAGPAGLARKARQVREAGNMEELEWTVEQFKAWFYETFDFSTKVHHGMRTRANRAWAGICRRAEEGHPGAGREGRAAAEGRCGLRSGGSGWNRQWRMATVTTQGKTSLSLKTSRPSWPPRHAAPSLNGLLSAR